MSTKHTIIKLRRGTAAEWSASEPQPGGEVLKLGEPGFEKDTGKLKIGDGVTPWNSLDYVAGGSAVSPEEIQDLIGNSFLASGKNIQITYDDNNDSLTISTTSDIKACSLELTGNSYYASEPVVVYQIDSTEANKVYDNIDTNIILTRGTDQWGGGGGLYNSALQSDYTDNGDSGPAGTEWNADGWDDLSNITTRTYNSLYHVLNEQIGKEITNAELVMHDTINNKYYKFDFTYWQPGGGQNVGPNYPIGGFQYIRTLLWVQPEPVVFTRPSNSENTVDNIDTGLTIKRKTSGGGGIYNAESESGWDVSMSPSGTLWNVEGWSNLSNIASRDYRSFYAATGGQLGNMVTTRQYVMKDTINNKYYKIQFTNWGNQGAFEYTRQEINGYCQGNITFSDGSVQNTAYSLSSVSGVASGIVDAAFNTSLVAGSGVSLSYNNNVLTISSSGTPVTVSDILSGTNISVTSSSGVYTINHNGDASVIKTMVFNKTGSQIPKMRAVYINGGQGDMPTIALASYSTEATSSKTYGITAEAIDHMSTGIVVVNGALTGLDTDQFNPTAPTGDVNGVTLWLSTSGNLITTKPSAPNHMVSLGTIVRTHQNEGVIEVKVQNGFEIEELHNVAISGVTNNDVLVYNSGTSLWQNNHTVVFSNPSGITGASAITNIVQISQTDYDNLPSYDPNTVYIINT